jgi:hypothetical protein
VIDLGRLARSLVVERLQPFAVPEWLAASWREPAPFWSELWAWHDATGPVPLKSAPLGRYDFFHDLALRNLTIETPAFVWYEAAREPRELSFRELAIAASRRAEAWQLAGVEPGQIVALVRPLGAELLVSLLAALKLGLVFALVPPSGRRLARARLAAAGAAHVDVDDRYSSLFTDGASRLPREPPGAAVRELDRSHVYQPGQPLALVFDPASPAPTEPRPLACDAAYFGALRDGPIALDLRRGDALAAPGLPALSTLPALWLAALLSGSTYVHVTLYECEQAPQLLVERSFKTVGVSAPLRELVRQKKVHLGARWTSWFRDPVAAVVLEPWHGFIAAGGLQASLAMNLRWEPALGGCSLFSGRHRGRAHVEVLPSAGGSWSLADLAADVPASTDTGRLAVTPPGHADLVVTTNVVARHQNGWLSGGAMPPRPGGRTYPVVDALAAVATVEGCCAASVVLDPSGSDGAPSVTLLCFSGGESVDSNELASRARQRLADELGPDFLPDRVECFPLFPRRDPSGAADARWCHDQLRSGGLGRKSTDELYRLLSRLRQRVVAQPKEPSP